MQDSWGGRRDAEWRGVVVGILHIDSVSVNCLLLAVCGNAVKALSASRVAPPTISRRRRWGGSPASRPCEPLRRPPDANKKVYAAYL